MHFCTYFDINYIHRGLALYNSLEREASKFTLWILCFDDMTYKILMKLRLPNARLIHRQEFESGDDELVRAQQNRSMVEYYWTCTPSLPLYVLKQQDIDLICYLDADTFFFSNPKTVFDAMNHGSIFIVPHDYDEKIFRGKHEPGRFNVGVLIFRSDEIGLQCLRRWRDQCIEWCLLEAANGKWGDQGYLDEWPQRFSGVIISDRPGIHGGPWNIGKYRLGLDPKGSLLLNNDCLVCYHFHGVSMITSRIALIQDGHLFMNGLIRNHIYQVYVVALADALKQLYHAGHRIQSQFDYLTLLFLTKRFIRGTLVSNMIFA